MKSFNRKSNGQSNIFSKMCHLVSTNGSSIVTRLVARSLNERRLQIKTHQYRLHMVWSVKRNGVSSKRCIQRLCFAWEEIEKFCTEFMIGALDHLCTCVHEDIIQYLQEKAEPCFETIPMLKDDFPRCWIKEWQEYESHSKCSCPVSSSFGIEWQCVRLTRNTL
jgi:hypothetical protein